MTARTFRWLLAAWVAAGAGAWAQGQDKGGPARHKNPIIDKLTDVGPEAKRQGDYMLTEVIQFFERTDKILGSDDTTKAHMDNAYQRATTASAQDWSERVDKVQDAYAAWLKRQGKPAAKMPQDWRDYFGKIGDFLSEMANGRGARAVAWKRELNAAQKKFARYAERAPQAMRLYRDDIATADKELAGAKTTLEKDVATLDALKQHRRHLGRARLIVKNLQSYMVDEQKRCNAIMGDATWKPDTFQKGVTELEQWRDACQADESLQKNLRALPASWAAYAKTGMDAYRKTYDSVAKASAEFGKGELFKDSPFFAGVPYSGLLPVVDDMIAKVDARIAKIQK